jgi:hypothetical protein
VDVLHAAAAPRARALAAAAAAAAAFPGEAAAAAPAQPSRRPRWGCLYKLDPGCDPYSA